MSPNWSTVAALWQQLGVMTQLTHLDVQFPFNRTCPYALTGITAKAFQWCDIACLAGLTHLQHLTLAGNDACGRSFHSGLSFLSKLTALTELHMRLPVVDNINFISTCTQLRHVWVCPPPIRLGSAAFMQDALSAQECEFVSHLTPTDMPGVNTTLCWPLDYDAKPAFYNALRHLPHLTVVGAADWTLEVLPVFSSHLTRLVAVHGAWSEPVLEVDSEDPSAEPTTTAHNDINSRSCPHVKRLYNVAGSVPFQVFPNLAICCLGGSIETSALAGLSQQCKQLQVLDGFHKRTGDAEWCSMSPLAPCTERVQALYGLARLPHPLNTFVWSVYDDEEMAALVVAARNVPHVRINVPHGSLVTSWGIMHLGKLHMLDLELGLQGITLEPDAAKALMSCLDPRAHVRLYVASVQQADVFVNAVDYLAASHVSRPAWIIHVAA
jgi:hypothetical protein